MLEAINQMRRKMAEGDAKRDAGLTVPEGLVRHLSIPYGPDPENLTDVYYPEGTEEPLPTIISIHGGGWCYGDKKLYSHYCMRLAKRGFTVVNFDYRLAPEHPYPAPVEDSCRVLNWIAREGEKYCIDSQRLFVVGDSAGGQIAYQVLTMLTNKAYAELFSFPAPEGVRVLGCGMNCGCYFIPLNKFVTPKKMGLMFEAYFPGDYMAAVPQLKAGKYITKDFPPAFVTSSYNDFLLWMAHPLYLLLRMKGVKAKVKIYGTKKQKNIGHVFHVNCYLKEADLCNDEQCAFFRSLIV